MVYDQVVRGDEKKFWKKNPLRIDLKKLEIKNIKEQAWMSVDADSIETDT